MDTVFAVKFFGALVAIMNPVTNLPIFLGLTDGLTVAEQRRAALRTVFYSTLMSAIVAVGGYQILNFFGITVDDFRVAGGIVVAGIALHMLNGQSSPSHAGSEREKPEMEDAENVAFYPMTFPMLVGPGTIVTLVVFLQQADTVADKAAFAAILATVLLMVGVALYFAASIGARLSRTLRTIMSRLMGMILLAIAIEMIAAGLLKLLPGLAG